MLLSPIAERHLVDVQTYATHPDIGRMSLVPSPYPANGAWEWFESVKARRSMGNCEVFAVTEGEWFCGVISLSANKADWSTAHIDYWIAVPFQGRGVGTAAVGLAVTEASLGRGVRQLFSTCLLENKASARVLLKNGFRERDSIVAGDGRFAGQILRRFYLAPLL